MQHNKQTTRYFLGAHTPQGYVSRFDQLGDPKEGWRRYILKGGPGTGKSWLLKRLGERFAPEVAGPVEYLHCAADLGSLDGVIWPRHKLSIVDGTPPHALEPQYPGVCETIIPLGDCWDKEALFARREEMIALSDQCGRCHQQVVQFLCAAGALRADAYRIALDFTDTAKITRYAAGIAAREFKPRKGLSQTPKESVRFLSAVTDKGLHLFEETAAALCDRIYLLEDAYGACAPLLLAALRSLALSAGYDVTTCYCPTAPFDKIEHLLIPSAGLGFMTANRFHTPALDACRVIHGRRFTNTEKLGLRKKRLMFNLKGTAQMIDEASRLMAEAKTVHDQLEANYAATIDYDKLEDFYRHLEEDIARIIG